MTDGPSEPPDRSSGRRRIGAFLLICLLLLTAGGLVLVERRISRSAEEEWQRTSRLLDGRPTADDLDSRSELLPVVLRRLLVLGEPERSLELLESQPRTVRARFSDHEVASLLEVGELGRARRLWETRPRHRDRTPFAVRLERTLAAADSGLQAALFDRHGAPIAFRATDGTVRLENRVEARLVPSQSLAKLPELGGARVSLDLGLSRKLAEAFDGRLRQRVRGGVVVLDAEDSALLAAVSSEADGDLGHDFLLTRREPASIAKLLTTTASLRAGWDPDGEIRRRRCSGALRLGGEPLYCSSIGGNLRGLDHAMATSCNVAFAALGDRLGPSRLLAEYRRFGFGDPGSPQNPLYGGLLEANPSPRQLGDLSIGLNEIEITPLHAAVLARTMVDGYLETPHQLFTRDGLLGMAPRLSREDSQKQLLGAPAVPVGYVDGSEPLLRPEWLPTLHSAMTAVADPGGTAHGVEPHGFEIAMKTGTASDIATGFHINYIGFAPAENPRFAFAVRLTHGRTSRHIRRQARAVTREIVEVLEWATGRLDRDRGIEPTSTDSFELPDLTAEVSSGSAASADLAVGG